MPLISKNKMIRNHKIEGIGDDFIPDLLDKDILDEVILVNDDDAINMARILAKKTGIGVGISSGANFLTSVITAKDNENIVTIFADDLKKYLSTDLQKPIDDDENLISNQIEILSVEIVE